MRRALAPATSPGQPPKPTWEELEEAHRRRALAIARLALDNPRQTPAQLHARLPAEVSGPFEGMRLALHAMLEAARAVCPPQQPPGGFLH